MVHRIVLCMGAATVESVSDHKHASAALDHYDYVIVKDNVRFPHIEHCVDVAWVKDCLISGRLHPLPGEEENA